MTKQLPYTEGISFFSVVAGRPSLFLLQANEDKTGMDFMHDSCEAYMSHYHWFMLLMYIHAVTRMS